MNEKQKKKAVVRDMQKKKSKVGVACLTIPKRNPQFQPSELAAATGAEM